MHAFDHVSEALALRAREAGEAPPVLRERTLALLRAVMEAGRALMTFYGAARASLKADGSHVTDADLASSEVIRGVIQRSGLFGDFQLIDEESAPTRATDAETIVFDPLDGTTNFLLGVPFFSVALGLLRDRVPYAGLVYNPASGHLFVASWDVAAGCVVAREAGASTTDLAGEDFSADSIDLLAAPPSTHTKLLSILKAVGS